MSGDAAYITNISAFLPNPPVANDDMERILGQVGERPSRARRMVLRSNQIRQRHYAIDPETLEPNYTNAEMTAIAVRQLADSHFNLAEIDCLACGTSIADQLMPSHAAMVHGELALPAMEIAATSGVCASGMAALKYAYMGVLAKQFKHAVATGSDLSSRMMNAGNFNGEYEARAAALESNPEIAFEKDFLRWMLSDGAGAMLVESKPRSEGLSLKINWLDILSYAGEMEACMYAGAEKNADGRLNGWQSFSPEARTENSIMAVKQDVKLLNEHIIHYTVEKPLQALQQKHALSAEDVDWFVPHYSSGFFRDKVLAGLQAIDLNIPQERWFTNLTHKGNTGAASMYIMLADLLNSGLLQPGQNILCYIPESGRFSTAFLYLTVV
ncbi:beta-ketoacyl-ACP synthase III [Halioxenophilus sp. WMMB6]|uniref:beta-ketoacyl-ACP synthase III n=1 Tax=Halioxenophilus sp. WMMB6 TaxID=3073815 RepID=UPI00295EAF35|nr:beta-ketoacyl-ACP synthase III [Halioxenophilus sp. WMMB6]